MANNFEKILTIEQQIEKLKEKQKRLEEQMQLNIGRELLKVWDVDSEEEALRWVQELAVHVNGENKTFQDEVLNNEG
jgi:AmiR/NasT family two-component response regulator